ncbi:hypothetical protein D9X30_3481 [Cupriavidus sp. U2]|uniref:hypothetical protein n=1 Tax=Cupriavidus sp. U2 TaxID=2920269 RepID=UPI00129DC922|nr:hypothetical protein [Cupriavidus sp. U2]KAI3591656.1 hypothetical protein D9X30_3481 [Cupriavidus sp. U2]
MPILSKKAILEAADLETKDVEVPEWGGSVRVAVMSGRDRDEYYARQGEGKLPYSLFSASILVATVVDEDGKPLFTAEDIDPLRAKSQAAMDRVLAVALKINGLGPGAIEEAEKNSDAAPSGDSGSASQLSSAAQ